MASRKAKPKAPVGAVTVIPPAANGSGGNNHPNTDGLKPGGKIHRTTRDVKEMILDALEQAGGVNYLLYQAVVAPQLFMPLIGKVLPLKVAHEGEVGVVHHYIQRKSVPSSAKKK